jgi:hypothetical protein
MKSEKTWLAGRILRGDGRRVGERGDLAESRSKSIPCEETVVRGGGNLESESGRFARGVLARRRAMAAARAVCAGLVFNDLDFGGRECRGTKGLVNLLRTAEGGQVPAARVDAFLDD